MLLNFRFQIYGQIDLRLGTMEAASLGFSEVIFFFHILRLPILTDFVLCCFTRRDNSAGNSAGLLFTPRMTDYQNTTMHIQSKRDPTFFLTAMRRIVERQSFGVAENGCGAFKTDSMFAGVGSRLLRVPFEIESRLRHKLSG